MITLVNKLESINNSYNYGVIQLLDENRDFAFGDLIFGSASKEQIGIYGKPNFEELVNKIFDLVIEYINIDNNVIIRKLNVFFKNTENTPIPAVKDNLKKYIQDLKSTYSNGIATTIQELVKTEESLVKTIRKINTVLLGLDGKILETGKPRVYKLSETNEVKPNDNGITNTKSEMAFDYNKFGNLIENEFTPLVTETYRLFNVLTFKNGNFDVLDSKLFEEDIDKTFFMIMSRILTDKNKKQQFIDKIILGELKTWKTPVSLLNKFEKIVDELDKDYSKELKLEENIFKNLKKDKKYKELTDGIEDKMYVKGKVRKFNYTTVGATPEDEKIILDLYSTVNSNTDRKTFNGKNTFN